MKPEKAFLRMYNVGFGDCFLLSVEYDGGDQRHVLFDFGSSEPPARVTKANEYMKKVAEDIRDRCKDPKTGEAKLHVLVATHRHRDHISGFATGTGKAKGSGNIIAELKPGVVIQPWTEDPDADPEAKKAKRPATRAGKPDNRAFVGLLNDLHRSAGGVLKLAMTPSMKLGVKMREQLHFLGEDNLKNASAVNNLIEMGRKTRAYFVRCGDKLDLAQELPGVGVTVLGPPDLTQTEKIRKMRSRDPDEFWHLASFWRMQAGPEDGVVPVGPLFPPRLCHQGAPPPHARWFVERAQSLEGEQLLEIVRALDDQMNNTSAILLFRIGKARLLFPGDAQIENWAYALGQKQFQKLLRDVTVYKVGHHGSLNATPKTLWKLFDNKCAHGGKKCRFKTFMSTKAGKHGSPQRGTEVPRKRLVDALNSASELFDSREISVKELYREVEIAV